MGLIKQDLFQILCFLFQGWVCRSHAGAAPRHDVMQRHNCRTGAEISGGGSALARDGAGPPFGTPGVGAWFADCSCSASCKRSSKSDSTRPFDSKASYPECAGSLFHAVIFAATRTRAPPEDVEVMRTLHW